MSDDFTPDTVLVRTNYALYNWQHTPTYTVPKGEAEFDRWLAEYTRQVQAEAWDAGHKTRWRRGLDECQCGAWSRNECGCGLYGTGELLSLADNPHREERA